MVFEKLEGGGYRKFTITSSIAFDQAPSFAFFDDSGTLVHSYTATQSSTTAYYAFADLPSSAGYYYYEWAYGQTSKAMVAKGLFEIVRTTAIETDLYCDANDVRNLYKPLSTSDLRNDEIDQFIRDIMNEVDSKLGHIYGVPFQTAVDSFPQIIGTITKNLTLVSILEQRGGEAIPNWIARRDERYRGMLDDIAAGNFFLTLSGGTVLGPSLSTTAVQMDHSMEDYEATFNMLDPDYQRIDPDRTNDEEDALD